VTSHWDLTVDEQLMDYSFCAFALLASYSLGMVNNPMCWGSDRRRILSQAKQQVEGSQKLIIKKVYLIKVYNTNITHFQAE
jgi:hypothetical protein